MRGKISLLKPFVLKKPGLALLCSLMLLLVAIPSEAAFSVGEGEFQVSFGIDSNYFGFSFDGLALDFNADLSARDGVKGEFAYYRSGVDTIAYYYFNDVFRDDQLNIGRFSIEWASDQSETMNGSLAQRVQWSGGIAIPRDYGFNRGVGVKYKIDLEKFDLVASVSNNSFGEGTDFVGRGAFKLNPDLGFGVGLASINRAKASDASDLGLLIDADFTTGPLNLLCEVVAINSRQNEQKETNVGLYVEAAYELSESFLFYGGFYGAKDLINELVVVGGQTRINSHAIVQGEIRNTRDDWDLVVGLNVNF